MEDVRRVLREVLETEHDDHDISRADDPETGRGGCIHDRDHEERCGQEEQHELKHHERRHGDADVDPRIHERADTEGELAESFYIENLRHEVEEHVDRAEAVLDKVTALHLESQVPVIVEKALDRRQRDQRKSVEEQHVVVVPAVDRREVLKEDEEGHES